VTAPDRLRRSGDVVATLRTGRHRAGSLLALHVRRREPATGPARLTTVASRRVGGAVRRNRAKRLLRAAAQDRPWRDGLDLVLVARPACADADMAAVRSELEAHAARLDALVGPPGAAGAAGAAG
jgi:ribonuclease P protein component